jgi:hypothetical protein
MEVLFMKQFRTVMFMTVLVLSSLAVMTGCATGPKLGKVNVLQAALNSLPEVPMAGKQVKFEFGGDTWITRVDGKGFLAGTLTFEETADGAALTLSQTHVYSDQQKPGIGGDVGWVKTPGPKIVLEYKKGPPETLTVK